MCVWGGGEWVIIVRCDSCGMTAAICNPEVQPTENDTGARFSSRHEAAGRACRGQYPAPLLCPPSGIPPRAVTDQLFHADRGCQDKCVLRLPRQLASQRAEPGPSRSRTNTCPTPTPTRKRPRAKTSRNPQRACARRENGYASLAICSTVFALVYLALTVTQFYSLLSVFLSHSFFLPSLFQISR